MEIILLKDVEKLGGKGAVANVADGYARNFLLPRKLAELATPGRVAADPQGRRREGSEGAARGRAGRRGARPLGADRRDRRGRRRHR